MAHHHFGDMVQPVLFLGHGSPMTAITDGPHRRAWETLGRRLPRPNAIVVVSAHWETQGEIRVTADEKPRTIHDFRGFPQALYDISYPAPGSRELVARLGELVGAVPDTSWGFDHSSWGVVQPIFPAADVPMVHLSLDRSLSPEQHLEMGRKLVPLRDEGVLVVASGNIIHNLAQWRASTGTQPDWAATFRARTNAAILSGDDAELLRLASGDPSAELAINTGEHFLPLLYAIGARRPGDGVALFNDRLDGALSMTSVLIGDTALVEEID